jgi:uncharacterized protein (TIGR04255 family)
MRKFLKNKPLVEAIFESRWKLQDKAGEVKIDPHYKILVGRIYDRVRSEYPFHESLSTASMPDEIAGYVVQHRFRKGEGEWPLIQVGPGIVTLNDTDQYIWEDFDKRISNLLDSLFDAYPDAENNLKINGLRLRYIDAVDFDYEKDDIFDFLKEKMKLNVKMYEKLFDDKVSKSPLQLDIRFSFPCTRPKGAVYARFGRAKRKGADTLMWETVVQSLGEDTPTAKDRIIAWVAEAHGLTDDWFFKTIEGELLRRFE